MIKKINCILLIDDDEASNYLSNLILEESGVAEHIKVKQTAKAALNYITDSAGIIGKNITLPYPDLIFLDINMPAMNGWEFIEQYKELIKQQYKKIIIVMLTTSINPDDRVKALGIAEICAFENKPLSEETIEYLMKKFFSE